MVLKPMEFKIIFFVSIRPPWLRADQRNTQFATRLLDYTPNQVLQDYNPNPLGNPNYTLFLFKNNLITSIQIKKPAYLLFQLLKN